MPEAIPTPFDITDIPYMAWIPGSMAWLTALLMIATIALGAWLSQRRGPRQSKQGRLLASLLRDLQSLSDERGALYPDRALRLATRMVCTLEGQSWAALSPEELRRRSSSYADTPHKRIISCLADLHEILCQPETDGRMSRIDALVRELADSLSTIINERRRA